jgi:hypothetical protein
MTSYDWLMTGLPVRFTANWDADILVLVPWLVQISFTPNIDNHLATRSLKPTNPDIQLPVSKWVRKTRVQNNVQQHEARILKDHAAWPQPKGEPTTVENGKLLTPVTKTEVLMEVPMMEPRKPAPGPGRRQNTSLRTLLRMSVPVSKSVRSERTLLWMMGFLATTRMKAMLMRAIR